MFSRTRIVSIEHHKIILVFGVRASATVASHEKMKTQSSRSPRRRESCRLRGDDGGTREIRRCLMPRLSRSVSNTYCGPQSCRDFHRTDAPVFPGAVMSCARFNLPLTSAPPPLLPFHSPGLVAGNHQPLPSATPGISCSNASLLPLVSSLFLSPSTTSVHRKSAR